MRVRSTFILINTNIETKKKKTGQLKSGVSLGNMSVLGLFFLLTTAAVHAFRVGTGIFDVTGPAVEINFMGYAVPGQRGTGIHQRLRARAFVIGDDDDATDYPKKRVVFVSVDGGMASDIVKNEVVMRLQAKFGLALYSAENVAISGTHSHSGPGGYLAYILYQSTSWGFVQETYDAWVEGIFSAIVLAHDNMQDANIQLASGQLLDSNINRSPSSYLLNPQEERDLYPEGDTDKNMLLLRFSSGNKVLGAINWFAVHATR